jgi:sterol desaturase/sphingolipid hydroxylase (fatty acid hydroxylase superfamily)
MTPSTDFFTIFAQVVPHAFVFDLVRYAAGTVPVALAVWFLSRTFWPTRWIQPRRAKMKQVARELLLSLRSILVYSVVGTGTVWAIANGLFPRVEGEVSALRWTLTFAAILVAHDAYFYWTHRAMHSRALFKHFHREHHRSVTPTPFAAYAFDVPEAVVMVLFMPLWLGLVPTPDSVTFAFLGVMIVRNAMGHAGFELHPAGWASHPLLKWVSTTTHHDMHHHGGFDSNYGFYFTFWDKLIGTEHPHYVRKFDEVTATPAREDVAGLALSRR